MHFYPTLVAPSIRDAVRTELQIRRSRLRGMAFASFVIGVWGMTRIDQGYSIFDHIFDRNEMVGVLDRVLAARGVRSSPLARTPLEVGQWRRRERQQRH